MAAGTNVETAAWYTTALGLVKAKHAGEVDALNRPYFEHFVRVARGLVALFPAASRAEIEAALLHDAFEPGGFSERELLDAGASPEAIAMVRAVTLPTDDRAYARYIADVCATENVGAIRVKLADNLDAHALFTEIGDAASLALVQTRYVPARRALEDALAGTPAT